MNNTILIAGGNGFLGNALRVYFQNKGAEVRILTRSPKTNYDVYWDAKNMGDWLSDVEWASTVINLTGKSVDCRYTAKNKKAILASRIDSTHIIAKAIQKVENPPQLWINAASSTIYVHSETQGMTEDEGIIGDDFSMNICKQWEAEFFKHNLEQTRRVALRTAIVLGVTGGAFPKLKQLTKLFLGGQQGNGNQFISWIHITDFCRAVEFAMAHPEIVGPVNITSPTPLTNKGFMQKMRTAIGRPFGIGQSKWMLELGAKIIGTETELLLKSRNVIPERLVENGFQFEFETLEECLQDLCKK